MFDVDEVNPRGGVLQEQGLTPIQIFDDVGVGDQFPDFPLASHGELFPVLNADGFPFSGDGSDGFGEHGSPVLHPLFEDKPVGGVFHYLEAQVRRHLVDVGRGLEGEGQLHAHPTALVEQFDELVGDDGRQLVDVNPYGEIVGGCDPVGIINRMGQITQQGFSQGPGDVGVAEDGQTDVNASVRVPELFHGEAAALQQGAEVAVNDVVQPGDDAIDILAVKHFFLASGVGKVEKFVFQGPIGDGFSFLGQ